MKILAVEFSSERRSVAAIIDGVARGHAEETSGRTTKTFELISQTLRQAGLAREEIECLAVGLGPGSYAGIRGAIATAQGWQLARSIRLLGLSSVEAMAWQAQAGGLFGRIHVLIDAQRQEFYLTSYEIDALERRVVAPLRLATFDQARAVAAPGDSIVCPGSLPGFPHAQSLWPDAVALGQLAAKSDAFVSGEQLEPIYLRETSFVKAPPPRVFFT